MPVNNQNLEQRRLGWYVVVEVPPSLRETIGKKRLVRSLQTRSLHEARIRRHEALAELRAVIEAARNGAAGEQRAKWLQDAQRWREALAEAQANDNEDEEDTIRQLISQEAEARAKKNGAEQASAFYNVAQGLRTPTEPLLDPWLAEARGTKKTKDERRYAHKLLTAWMKKYKHNTPTTEGVTRKLAGEFVTQELIGTRKLTPASINKLVSSLSLFWEWMEKRGHRTGENPWKGQGVSKTVTAVGAAARTAEPRPFTDAEAKTLLTGDADEDLRDLIFIGALSGMRIESITKLKVADCADGVFNVARDKTTAGTRQVPIHSALKGIIERRTKGKAAGAYLFPEESAKNKYGKRSNALGKRFGRYRVKLGVDERPDGQRTSNVDFHSWRRWFIQRAEWAGQPPHIIQSVVGHKREGMTLGVYSKVSSEEQHRACVEAVKLPKGVTP
jgi:hypothetical protein